MRKLNKKQQGFSLLELLSIMVVVGVFIMGLNNMLDGQSSVWRASSSLEAASSAPLVEHSGLIVSLVFTFFTLFVLGLMFQMAYMGNGADELKAKQKLLSNKQHKNSWGSGRLLKAKMQLLSLTDFTQNNYRFNLSQLPPDHPRVDVKFLDGTTLPNMAPQAYVLNGRWALRSANPVIQYKVTPPRKDVIHIKSCLATSLTKGVTLAYVDFYERLSLTLHQQYLTQGELLKVNCLALLSTPGKCACSPQSTPSETTNLGAFEDVKELLSSLDALTHSFSLLNDDILLRGSDTALVNDVSVRALKEETEQLIASVSAVYSSAG